MVNVITGDNQLAGNRMMLGWSGTDTLYLKLTKPGEAARGLERRHESEEDAGEQAQPGRESQHGTIQGDLGDPWHVGRED